MLSRRRILALATSAVALAGATIGRRSGRAASPAPGVAESFEINKTDAEWRAQLTEAEYNVLREHGTERPSSSPLLHEKREGVYKCKGCDLPVYASQAKFDSGTGWPSFTESLPDAVGTQEDYSWFMLRTEVHCRRCGGHFGHIFDDGPPPAGKRHCLNGIALTFEPTTAS